MSEHVTISDAARRLGISRPRLSTFIKNAGIKKTVGKNGAACVPFEQVSELVRQLGAEGKLRVSTRAKRQSERTSEHPSTQSSDVLKLVHQMLERLTEENRELKDALRIERESASKQIEGLSEKVDALRAEIGSLKLLPAARARAGATSIDEIAAVVDEARQLGGEQIEFARRHGVFSRLLGGRRRDGTERVSR